MTLHSTFPNGHVTVTDAQFKAMLDQEKRLMTENSRLHEIIRRAEFELSQEDVDPDDCREDVLRILREDLRPSAEPKP